MMIDDLWAWECYRVLWVHDDGKVLGECPRGWSMVVF